MRIARRIIAGAALVVALATSAAADTIKIGVIATFSGPFARMGAQMQHGVEAYQKAHGKSVNGHTIEVLYRDDGGADPARARKLVEELVLRERVKMLGGFVFTPNIAAAAELVTEAAVPTVIFGAIGADIVRRSPYFVRTSYTGPQVVVPVGQWAAKSGIKTAITIVSDYAPGYDAEQYFQKSFTGAGGRVLETIRAPLSTTDFAPFFERILQQKPDAVFMFAPGGPPAVGMIKTWSERGLRNAGIQLLVTGETQEIDLPSIGPSAEGVVGAFHYTERTSSPANEKLRQALNPGVVPDFALVGAYDGMHAIYETVRQLGAAIEGKGAVEVMRKLSFESPRGPVRIDPETRDIIQNVYIRRTEKRDGQLVNVNFDTVPMVKDPWKEENPERARPAQ